MVQTKENNTSTMYMTYCLGCKKHTNNIASRGVTITNKVLKQKSKGCVCLSDKSRFLKQIPNKKSF